MISSCLIEDPPPYTKPEQTPPRLDLRKAFPLIDQVITRSTGDRVSFNVPVASEDAGDKLVAFLLLNNNGDNRDGLLGTTEVSPGTLDQTTRNISLDWTIDNSVQPGCQRLTLMVTHYLNVSYCSGSVQTPSCMDKTGPVYDKSDVAIAVWWVIVNPTAGSAVMLMDCPEASQGGQ